MSEESNDDKKYYRNNLFTRETFGVILGVFSLIVLFVLFSRGAVFGTVGEAIAGFVLGVVGYAAYPAFIALTYFSIKLIFGIKTPVTGKERALIFAIAALTMLIVHTATVSAYSFEKFGDYISACFNAVEKTGSATGLGVIGGLITYPIIRYTTSAGAYILCGVLIAVMLYATIRHFYTKKSDGKKSLAERRQEKMAAKKVEKKVVIDTAKPYPVNLNFEDIRSGESEAYTPSEGYAPDNYSAPDTPSAGAGYPENRDEAPQSYGYSMDSNGSTYTGASDKNYYGGETRRDSIEDLYSSQGYYNPYAYDSPRSTSYSEPESSRSGKDSYSVADVKDMTDDERRSILFGGNPIDYRVQNLIYNKDSRYNNRSVKRSQSRNSIYEDIPSPSNDTKMYKDGSYVYKEEPDISNKTYIESYEEEKDSSSGGYTPSPRIYDAPTGRDEIFGRRDRFFDSSGSDSRFGGREDLSGSSDDSSRREFSSSRDLSSSDDRFGGREDLSRSFGREDLSSPTEKEDSPRSFGDDSLRRDFSDSLSEDKSDGDISSDLGRDTPRETLRDFRGEEAPSSPESSDSSDDILSHRDDIFGRRDLSSSDDSLRRDLSASRDSSSSDDSLRRDLSSSDDSPRRDLSSDDLRPSRGDDGQRFGRMSRGSDDESRRAMREALLGKKDSAPSNGGYFSSSLDISGSRSSKSDDRLTPTDEKSPFDTPSEDSSSDRIKRNMDFLLSPGDSSSEKDKEGDTDDSDDRSRFLDDDITPSDDITPPSGMRGESPSDAGHARGMGIFGKNDYSSGGDTAEPSKVSEYKREPPKPITPPHNMSPAPVSNYPPKQLPVYKAPPLELFRKYNESVDVANEEVNHNKEEIIRILAAFNIRAEISSVVKGPAFTRYDVTVPINVTSKKVASCATEIAMHLQAKDGVNIYPNLANGTNSIEVPNKKRGLVGLAPLLSDKAFTSAKPEDLTFAIGRDVEGKNIYGRIAKMTHLLVAGATGAGKSVFLNTLLLSLITHYTPWQLRLILVDPKKIEFTIYNHLPHLMMDEIITEAPKAIATLNWAIDEMERRYMLFDQMTKSGKLVRNIDEYNQAVKEKKDKLPKIVIVVDELADLMSIAKKEIEDRISRLAAKSRACGIHLVLATQRPSVDVITGVIKSNLPTRFAFKVAAEVDSRTILDEQGAEKLLGYGDMLYKTAQMYSPVRVQGALVESDEVQQVVEWIKKNNECYYDPAVLDTINKKMNEDASSGGGDDDPEAPTKIEPVFINALEYVIMQKSASISMLQRKFSIGYNKAGRIIEWMESMNYISAFDGSKSRSVSLTMDEFIKKYRSGDGEGEGGAPYGGQ